jgi:hypothetical protein
MAGVFAMSANKLPIADDGAFCGKRGEARSGKSVRQARFRVESVKILLSVEASVQSFKLKRLNNGKNDLEQVIVTCSSRVDFLFQRQTFPAA